MSPEQESANNLFLQACRREEVERTPVWFMRQAGRYLPEYRAIREKTDFLTLCKTPDLAAEVTVQPVDLVGVDAAIIFSDILVAAEAMGMQLIVEEGKGGPRFPSPIRSKSEIDRLTVQNACASLGYVYDAIRLTRKRLNNKVPLIGFAGAPWTIASYMVEGRNPRDFRHIKQMIYSSPHDAHGLIEKVATVVSMHLRAQAESGAQALQIFDTWGGVLGQEEFEEFSLRYIKQVVAAVRGQGIPIIVFCKNCGHSLEKIANTGADVVSLDWTIDIGKAREMVGSYVGLQGNLDPAILFSTPERIESAVKSILKKFGKGNGHVFNLGHGISPETPVENVKAIVHAVRKFSPAYH
jgi:uroporphyrinogen decarboxylase